jgi:hypothetical protein
LDLYNEYEPPLKDTGCREWQYLCIAEFLVMVMLAVAFIVYCMVPSDATIRAAREEKERQRLLTDRDERIKELESRVEMMGQALEDFENAAENNAAGTNDDEEVKASLVAAQAEAAELAQQLAKAQAAERDADALIESLTSGNKKLAVEVADLAAQLKKLKGDDTAAAAAAAAAAAKRIADLEAQVRAPALHPLNNHVFMSQRRPSLPFFQVRNITAENVQAEKYASEAVAARDAALKRVTALEDAAKKNAADSVAMKTAHDEHVQNLEDEVAAHVTWRETTRLAKDATPTPAGDLATVNTQLTAQLSALHKEFNEYREAADKLIAELQQANAASTPAPAPAPLTSPTAASARPALSNVPRGASRLAKLGLEDPDEVAALKAQLAKLQERASALAAHLNHAKVDLTSLHSALHLPNPSHLPALPCLAWPCSVHCVPSGQHDGRVEGAKRGTQTGIDRDRDGIREFQGRIHEGPGGVGSQGDAGRRGDRGVEGRTGGRAQRDVGGGTRRRVAGASVGA